MEQYPHFRIECEIFGKKMIAFYRANPTINLKGFKEAVFDRIDILLADFHKETPELGNGSDRSNKRNADGGVPPNKRTATDGDLVGEPGTSSQHTENDTELTNVASNHDENLVGGIARASAADSLVRASNKPKSNTQQKGPPSPISLDKKYLKHVDVVYNQPQSVQVNVNERKPKNIRLMACKHCSARFQHVDNYAKNNDKIKGHIQASHSDIDISDEDSDVNIED